MRDDVLVEDGDVVEAFEQVERDVRLPLGGQTPDLAEIVVDAERLHLMSHRGQRRDDVVLGPPRFRRDVGARVDADRGNQVPMNQGKNPHRDIA